MPEGVLIEIMMCLLGLLLQRRKERLSFFHNEPLLDHKQNCIQDLQLQN